MSVSINLPRRRYARWRTTQVSTDLLPPSSLHTGIPTVSEYYLSSTTQLNVTSQLFIFISYFHLNVFFFFFQRHLFSSYTIKSRHRSEKMWRRQNGRKKAEWLLIILNDINLQWRKTSNYELLLCYLSDLVLLSRNVRK